MSPSQHGTTDNLPRKPAPGPSIRTNLESFCPDHARSRPSPGGPPKLSCSTMRSHGTFGAVSPLEPADLLAAYDAPSRPDPETPGPRPATRLGSLRLAESGKIGR